MTGVLCVSVCVCVYTVYTYKCGCASSIFCCSFLFLFFVDVVVVLFFYFMNVSSFHFGLLTLARFYSCCFYLHQSIHRGNESADCNGRLTTRERINVKLGSLMSYKTVRYQCTYIAAYLKNNIVGGSGSTHSPLLQWHSPLAATGRNDLIFHFC